MRNCVKIIFTSRDKNVQVGSGNHPFRLLKAFRGVMRPVFTHEYSRRAYSGDVFLPIHRSLRAGWSFPAERTPERWSSIRWQHVVTSLSNNINISLLSLNSTTFKKTFETEIKDNAKWFQQIFNSFIFSGLGLGVVLCAENIVEKWKHSQRAQDEIKCLEWIVEGDNETT